MSHHLTILRRIHFITLLVGIFLFNLSPAAELKLEPRKVELEPPANQSANDLILVERYLAASFDFESGAQGWTSEDWSGANFEGPAFHVDDFSGLDGGLAAISGDQSLWCGTKDPDYLGGAGYGDNWIQMFQTIPFPRNGDVVLSYNIRYDLESYDGEDFDILYVKYLNITGEWVEIAAYGGQSDVIPVTHVIPAASLGETTQIAFDFRSDPVGSDESVYEVVFDSDGAVIIDDLVITDNVGTILDEDFEGYAVNTTEASDGFWYGFGVGGRGDFAGLYSGGEVLQEDPNNFNGGQYWGFFNHPALTNYACGGHPEQGAVPYENEWGFAIHNAIISPPIDLTKDINNNSIPSMASGVRIIFDVYLNLPIEEGVYYHWSVRTQENGEWTAWRDDGYVYYGEHNRWQTRAFDLPDLVVGPGTTFAQVAVACIDLGETFNFPGDCHTQGPLIDNVQVELYDPEGPNWDKVDRFADVFQIAPNFHGVNNGEIIFDENDPDAEIRHLDALTFVVEPAYPAESFREIQNPDSGDMMPAVLVYVTVSQGDLGYDQYGRTEGQLQSNDLFEDPDSSSNFLKYPFVGVEDLGGRTWFKFLTWQGDDAEHPHDQYLGPNVFHFDLNDFTGSETEGPTWRQGDVVQYFFSATDDFDRTSYFSHNLEETTDDIATAADSPSEFCFLPSWENEPNGDPVDSCDNRVLLVESSLDLETRAAYENALEEMGWCWDRFDNPREGGGLYYALAGATPPSLYHYKAIIYAGSINEKGYLEIDEYSISDFQILKGFLDHFQDYDLTGAARTGVYLAGGDVATDWDHNEAPELNSTYFGFALEDEDQTDLGLSLAPNLESTADWSLADYSLELESEPYHDVLSGPAGGLVFSENTQYKALTWKYNDLARTTGVIGTFGLEDIEGEGLATYHLGKILEKITEIPFGTETVHINTVPSGIDLVVDGLVTQTPATFLWAEGSDHTVQVLGSGSTANDGSECVFLNWEDGQRVIQRDIHVPPGSGDLDFTAYFLGGRQLTENPFQNLGPISGMAWSDIGGDDLEDLFLARATQEDIQLSNRGPGGIIGDFAVIGGYPWNHGPGSQGAAWADYDNDGDQDFYLVTNTENHLYKNVGNGEFLEVTAGPLPDPGNGRSAAWADYDLDGDLDLYIANFDGPNRLLRNDGADVFVDQASGLVADGGPSVAGIWADYDNDGYPDLYVVNNGTANRLLRNEGGTGFIDASDPALEGSGISTGAAWGDFDNDGYLDLFVANHTEPAVLLRNNDGVDFQDVTTEVLANVYDYAVSSASWCDYDNNGVLDLYRSASIGPSMLLLGSFSGGQSSFQDLTPPPLAPIAPSLDSRRESAWADYNGDGYLDAMLSDSSETDPVARLVANSGQLENHWLQLDLEGTASNRDGLGARVEVVTSAGLQYRQLFPSNGGAQNSRILHFGLGATDAIQEINIHWPVGGLQTLTGVAVDQILTVIQEVEVPNTEEGTDVTVQPVDEQSGATPVTVTFDQVDVAGNTTVTVTELEEAPPQSYQIGTPPQVYDIETTAGYEGTVDLCFDYSGTTWEGAEEDIRVFHFNVDTDDDGIPDSWGDPIEPSSHDLENDIICITTSSLSPFAVFEPVEPAIGSLVGQVIANCPEPGTGLFGVPVGIYSMGEGELEAEAVTDQSGAFEFPELPVGDYVVTLVTPLGYAAVNGDIPITVTGGQIAQADFSVECVDAVGNPRGTGYWKHQVGVATGGNGNAQISAGELCGYLDMIAGHFNSNAINEVVVYEPPESSECQDKLGVAKLLLNLRGQQEQIARARQHFMATLLNVAAGNLVISAPVSEDGATLSQAITFCDGLIDVPEGDHELAKDIAETINKGRLVQAGIIPLDTENIAYRISSIPKPYSLDANRPNPFNPSTTIAFSIPQGEMVRLAIYSLDGRLVRSLLREHLSAGSYRINWNGVDDRGSRVASGIYFYQIVAGEFMKTRKMTLIK